MRAKSAASAQRRRQAQSRDSTIPPLYSPRPRKGKCPQKIGMWGTISTDYRTPSGSTHDARYSQTVTNYG